MHGPMPYQILNLDEGTQENNLELYLVACLLAFYQQQRLYKEQESAYRPFNLEKPLWIFVGGSVTKTLATRDATDIIEILLFLKRYLADRAGSIQRIQRVLDQGIVTAVGRNLFAGRFTYLNTLGLTASQVFEDNRLRPQGRRKHSRQADCRSCDPAFRPITVRRRQSSTRCGAGIRCRYGRSGPQGQARVCREGEGEESY